MYIFSGKAIYLWYIACFIILSFYAFQFVKERSVGSYKVIVYKSTGEVDRVEHLSAEEMSEIIQSYPKTLPPSKHIVPEYFSSGS